VIFKKLKGENFLSKQEERDQLIYSKLQLDKLPYKLNFNSFKKLGGSISLFIKHINNFQNHDRLLNWCFSNVKRTKIFMEIFHANESGLEIYKEEISKNIPEYSYKTIAKIIDEGIEKGCYVSLMPDGECGKDGKVKNIRPSEELIINFLNLCIEIVCSVNEFSHKIKK